MEGITTDKMDCDTCLTIQEILSDEIEDEEFLNFAIENLEELSSHIINGNLNIRIHRDITGPPKDASDKPARRAVWRLRCGLGYDKKTTHIPQLLKNVGVYVMNQF